MTENTDSILSEVVEKMSFTKAAEELYVTQTAISKHISCLEEELGCLLFTRSQNGLRITPAGQLIHGFLEDAMTRFLDVVRSGPGS
jgi:DNA-binding transcriptional LysR family regulator